MNKPIAPGDRLFNRNFVLLWQGQLVSNFGSQGFLVAAMVFLEETAGSAAVMGALMAVSLIAQGLAAPIGGAVADRVRRHTVLVASDVVSGVSVCVLALWMIAWPQSGAIPWIMGLVFAVGGLSTAFFSPASRAILPAIVPESALPAANALTEGTMHGATLSGQAVAGTLLRVLGAPVLFLIDGVSYFLSAFSEVFIRDPAPGAAVSDSTGASRSGHDGAAIDESAQPQDRSWRMSPCIILRDVREGVALVSGNLGVRNLLVVSVLISLFAMPFVILLPFFVSHQLGARPDWFGFLLAGLGGGALAGYALASPVTWRGKRIPWILLGSLAVLSASLVVLGTVHRPTHALAVLVVAGMGQGVFQVGATTVLQAAVPDRHRARVFGLLQAAVSLLGPVSLVVTGAVVDAMGGDAARMFVVCGVLMVAVTGWAVWNRPLREFLAGAGAGNSTARARAPERST